MVGSYEMVEGKRSDEPAPRNFANLRDAILSNAAEARSASSCYAAAVVPRSWTKTSMAPFVSPVTRSGATEVNATKRASAFRATPVLSPFAWLPVLSTLTRSVVPD